VKVPVEGSEEVGEERPEVEVEVISLYMGEVHMSMRFSP
jgi:hypothetical protein